MVGALWLITIAYDTIQDKQQLIIAIGVIMTIYFFLKMALIKTSFNALKQTQEEKSSN